MSKVDELSTAVGLARKINFLKDEEDIKYLHQKPFIYDGIDEEDLKERLERLVPENMYVIYHSQKFKELKEESPDQFQREKWYSKDFTVEMLSEETIENLKSIMPDCSMGYPPPNSFMPKSIKVLKAARAEKPSKPTLVREDGNLKLYFKQDD